VITQRDVGQILSVLALSYSGPLFKGTFLALRDQQTFRLHSQQAIMKGNDAYFDSNLFAWVFDWEKAARDFLTSYSAAAASEDLAAFKWWIQNGYNGGETPDQLRHIWRNSLHWMRHHDEWQEGLSPETIERALRFVKAVSEERRSESFMNAIEDIRDHTDNEQDTLLKMKVNLEFYHEMVDPLLIFINMRGQMILMDAVRKSLHDAELVGALNRVPAAWWENEGFEHRDRDRELAARARIEELIIS
jgi:hypothetical protein